MEIVALNEELRREFSPVLKLLRTPSPSLTPTAAARPPGKKQSPVARSKAPAADASQSADAAAITPSLSSSPSTESPIAQATPAESPSHPAAAAEAAASTEAATIASAAAPELPEKPPQQLVRIDRFKQHCLTVVHRLNTYQYGTKQAFCQEIAQLQLVARTPEQQQELQRLSERVANADAPSSTPPATQMYGSLEFDMRASIPGLQEVEGDTPASKKWLCNVNVKEHSITIGSYLTRENALKAYELFRFDHSTNHGGAASVFKLAIDQRESDERVLQAAMSKVHTHVSWQRLQDMISLSTAPTSASGAAGTDKEQRDPNINTLVSTPSKSAQHSASGFSSPAPHHPQQRPSGIASSTSSVSSTSTASAKGKKRKKSADRLSHLRLRRLIQKRLCPHLKGKEVCVIRHALDDEKTDWTPTGRLESGKVFSYKYEKLVTFADFVSDDMRHPVSACPHIFLVKTRESIDDHLVVCDMFSDAERAQLGQNLPSSIQSFMKSPEPKASRRR